MLSRSVVKEHPNHRQECLLFFFFPLELSVILERKKKRWMLDLADVLKEKDGLLGLKDPIAHSKSLKCRFGCICVGLAQDLVVHRQEPL